MRIGIAGYGNLGRALARVARERGIDVAAVFSRREPKEIDDLPAGVPIYPLSSAEKYASEIDVMLVAGGSATDLGWMSPMLARDYNIIDSFDNHGKIPEHRRLCDTAARDGGHLAIVSVGWDPGILSLARLYSRAVMPDCEVSTVWGRGVSQGHSDAIRRLDGVRDAIQYTVPDETSISALLRGELRSPTGEQLHTRECYVVAEEGVDSDDLASRIAAIPSYFLGYRTSVKFVTEAELGEMRRNMAHRGRVISSGRTGGVTNRSELCLTLGSNPDFTAAVMLTYSLAALKMAEAGEVGARTVFDIAPSLLMPEEGYCSLL